MVVSKFPKCSEYALTSYYNREKKLIIEDYAEAVEQALTLAESKGAKAERERLYEKASKEAQDAKFKYEAGKMAGIALWLKAELMKDDRRNRNPKGAGQVRTETRT
jgi:hypothetical protein